MERKIKPFTLWKKSNVKSDRRAVDSDPTAKVSPCGGQPEARAHLENVNPDSKVSVMEPVAECVFPEIQAHLGNVNPSQEANVPRSVTMERKINSFAMLRDTPGKGGALMTSSESSSKSSSSSSPLETPNHFGGMHQDQEIIMSKLAEELEGISFSGLDTQECGSKPIVAEREKDRERYSRIQSKVDKQTSVSGIPMRRVRRGSPLLSSCKGSVNDEQKLAIWESVRAPLINSRREVLASIALEDTRKRSIWKDSIGGQLCKNRVCNKMSSGQRSVIGTIDQSISIDHRGGSLGRTNSYVEVSRTKGRRGSLEPLPAVDRYGREQTDMNPLTTGTPENVISTTNHARGMGYSESSFKNNFGWRVMSVSNHTDRKEVQSFRDNQQCYLDQDQERTGLMVIIERGDKWQVVQWSPDINSTMPPRRVRMSVLGRTLLKSDVKGNYNKELLLKTLLECAHEDSRSRVAGEVDYDDLVGVIYKLVPAKDIHTRTAAIQLLVEILPPEVAPGEINTFGSSSVEIDRVTIPINQWTVTLDESDKVVSTTIPETHVCKRPESHSPIKKVGLLQGRVNGVVKGVQMYRKTMLIMGVYWLMHLCTAPTHAKENFPEVGYICEPWQNARVWSVPDATRCRPRTQITSDKMIEVYARKSVHFPFNGYLCRALETRYVTRTNVLGSRSIDSIEEVEVNMLGEDCLAALLSDNLTYTVGEIKYEWCCQDVASTTHTVEITKIRLGVELGKVVSPDVTIDCNANERYCSVSKSVVAWPAELSTYCEIQFLGVFLAKEFSTEWVVPTLRMAMTKNLKDKKRSTCAGDMMWTVEEIGVRVAPASSEKVVSRIPVASAILEYDLDILQARLDRVDDISCELGKELNGLAGLWLSKGEEIFRYDDGIPIKARLVMGKVHAVDCHQVGYTPRATEICYSSAPVKIEGDDRNLFVNSFTREIIEHSPETKCPHTNLAIRSREWGVMAKQSYGNLVEPVPLQDILTVARSRHSVIGGKLVSSVSISGKIGNIPINIARIVSKKEKEVESAMEYGFRMIHMIWIIFRDLVVLLIVVAIIVIMRRIGIIMCYQRKREGPSPV